MSSRFCEAASSCSRASKARVWMSRRWGIPIPWSSLPKEICFIISGMYHPRAGEKCSAPAPCEKFASAGRSIQTSVVVRWSAITISRRVEDDRAGTTRKARAKFPQRRRRRGIGAREWGRSGRARFNPESRAPSPGDSPRSLLDLDRRALLLELGLDRVRLVLRDARLHRLRGAVHEVLRFLQAQAGDLAHDLDDLDLLRARVL